MIDPRTQIGLNPTEQTALDAAYEKLRPKPKPSSCTVRLLDRIIRHAA